MPWQVEEGERREINSGMASHNVRSGPTHESIRNNSMSHCPDRIPDQVSDPRDLARNRADELGRIPPVGSALVDKKLVLDDVLEIRDSSGIGGEVAPSGKLNTLIEFDVVIFRSREER
jgi:hypothetical protein